MPAPQFNRWLAASPDDRPAKVAVRALRSRLSAVRYYLKRAAKRADEDPKFVHDLRVGTRRAAAACELFEEFLPPRRAKWLEKQLARLRKAANEARDLDVLMARLQREPGGRARQRWLKQAAKERTKAQRPIVANYRRLMHDGRFKRKTKALLRRVKALHARCETKGPLRFDDWARLRLQPIAAAFFAAEPNERADAEAWHHFRIRGKELRYVMELLAGGFPREFRTRLYPLVAQVQDKLGDMNDLATSQARLHDRIAETHDADERRGLRLLAAQEQTQLDHARREFLDWYRGQPRETLRRGLETKL